MEHMVHSGKQIQISTHVSLHLQNFPRNFMAWNHISRTSLHLQYVIDLCQSRSNCWILYTLSALLVQQTHFTDYINDLDITVSRLYLCPVPAGYLIRYLAKFVSGWIQKNKIRYISSVVPHFTCLGQVQRSRSYAKRSVEGWNNVADWSKSENEVSEPVIAPLLQDRPEIETVDK